MANKTKRYTSSAEIQDHWIQNIAPNYFDFDNVNNYRSSIFGYINETMSTSVMDAYNAVTIARREFYPVSAEFPQSFYKMAALQKIDLPTATPAKCRAILLLDRDEVIENSVKKNNVYSCVIDNTVEIYADDMRFSLLYPIVIVSNINGDDWTHTIHYDKSESNSLDKLIPSNYYIQNKTIFQDGKKYLLLAVTLLQMQKESITQLVTTDSSIQTVSMLYAFEGDLANFEVYYIAEPDVSEPIQLVKIMQGQSMVEKPFCYYRLLNNNLLELTFPKNIYFTPELNSEVRVDIYTSLGSKGNFDSYNGSLSCAMDSEKYPYNNNMSMIGVIDGSSVNGSDIPSFASYTKKVQDAYSTNNTITTSNDLQIRFNRLSEDDNNRVLFRKKRMDAFTRDYGAYMLLKDKSGNVVPTNTLSVSMKLEDFDIYNGLTERAYIKPGAIFEYDPASNSAQIYTGMRNTSLSLSDDLSEYDTDASKFLYTTPFLIAVNMNPNLVGYYNNSINEIKSAEYSYINDASIIQFIGNNMRVERNAVCGENFYKFSINITPTTDIARSDIISIPSEEDEDYAIRAEQSGRVLSIEYEESAVYCNIEYDNGETDQILVSSQIEMNDDECIYNAGYDIKLNVYDSFAQGDLLATKKVTDLGKIRGCVNFKNILFENNYYIPMSIEEYIQTTNTYVLSGYISTDDIMENKTILINHGILNQDGTEDDNIAIPSRELCVEVSVFYDNDETNLTHKYSKFDYFKNHTLTNIYTDSSEEGISLVNSIDFIKSTLVYTQGDDNTEDNEDEYIITIKEIPMTKATWIKEQSNFKYLLKNVLLNYEKLKDIYFDLENNYSIDLKFYNTYGKSKFFRVGTKNNWTPLQHVNCSFRFGSYLKTVTTQSTFLEQFREYVKAKVESINSSVSSQSIYILNLVHDIIDNFSELGYIEYYGFDEYGSDIQKIEPIPTSELTDELLANYIPEFINICSYIENGENIPNIQVDFLQSVE